MSKNTQFLETQFPLGQAGILPRYFAFSNFTCSWRARIGTVSYCAAFYPRSPDLDAQLNVTSNPFFDFFSFRVALAADTRETEH